MSLSPHNPNIKLAISPSDEDCDDFDEQETSSYGWNASSQACPTFDPTAFSPTCLEDHFMLQGDLGENPRYSHLLTEQYKSDLRRNPHIKFLAGVFTEPPTTPQPIPETNNSVPEASSSIERGAGDAVDDDPAGDSTNARDPNQTVIPSTVPEGTPHSTASTSYEKNHICTYCGTAFDRFTRARDCRNMDLGLTPHKCLGQCGMIGCLVAYGSEALLFEHIHLHSVQCPWCQRTLLKKNMARHQKKSCPGRSLPAGPSETETND